MVRKWNVTWGSTPCNSASDTASCEMRKCELHVTLTRCTTVRIHISGCYTTTCMTTHPLTSSLDLFKGWYALFDLHSEPFCTKGGFSMCITTAHWILPPPFPMPSTDSYFTWVVTSIDCLLDQYGMISSILIKHWPTFPAHDLTHCGR